MYQVQTEGISES